MFALLIIKLKQVSYRSRLLAGISVGFVLLLILAGLINGVNSNDRLAKFARSNTTFYLSLNLSSAEKSIAGLKIIDRLLATYQLPDFNRKWLKSNLGQVCLAENNNQSCFLLFDARKTKEVQNYLTQKNIPYRRFGQIFAVADNQEKLKSLKTNWLFSPLKTHDKINRSRDLVVYLRPQANNSTKTIKIISLAIAQHGGLAWHGKLSGSTINLTSDQLSFPLVSWPLLSLGSLPKTDGNADLVITLAEPIKFWQKWYQITSASLPKKYPLQEKITAQLKKSYGFNLTDPLWTELATKPLSLIARSRSSSAGDLLNDYDLTLFLSAPNNLSATDKGKIESIMKKLVSRRQPIDKNIYLSDGTPVTELLSGGTPQESLSNEGKKVFANSDQTFVLFEQIKQDKLELGNNPDWQISAPNTTANYLKINLQAFKTYVDPLLTDFNWLEANNNKIRIY